MAALPVAGREEPLPPKSVRKTGEHGRKLWAGGEMKNCERAGNAELPEAEQAVDRAVTHAGCGQRSTA